MSRLDGLRAQVQACTACELHEGATKAVLGEAAVVLVTIHPSAVLRERDAPARTAAFERLVADLRVAADTLRLS